jgi:hypothetical protein
MLILVVTVLYIGDKMVTCRDLRDIAKPSKTGPFVQLIASPGVHDFFDIEEAPAYVVSANRFLRLLP